MSHHHLRTDKTCLNCGTHVIDRYCHVCGQENAEPKETVLHIARHFFEDLTHFDGKFMSSVKYLLFKPGFLTEEYLKGRRARYLHPIRMYMFISAMFFLVLLTITSHLNSEDLFGKDGMSKEDSVRLEKAMVNQARVENKPGAVQEELKDTRGNKGPDSVNQAKATIVTDSLKNGDQRPTGNHIKIDSAKKQVHFRYSLGDDGTGDEPNRIPINTVRQYDSLQKALPPGKRASFVSRYLQRRLIAADEYRSKHKDTATEKVLEKFFHSIPQMYFVSLPFFAFVLWLLYVRRRKQYNYVADVIFTIHFYCYSFIVFLLALLINEMGEYDIIDYIGIALIISLPIYLYIAMLRFYKQGWFKTLMKAMILNMVCSIFIALLVVAYIFNSFLSLGAK